MGVVYEAEQTSLRRCVALKVLRFGVVADQEAMQRFRREAETVARLHHTNIVPIFAFGCEQGVHYFAMQMIEGTSLADELRQAHQAGRPPDPRQVARWGAQAAEALRPLAPYDYGAPPHPGRLWYARFQWVPFRHPQVDFTRPADVYAAFATYLADAGRKAATPVKA